MSNSIIGREAKESKAGWLYCPENFNPSRYPGVIAKHPDACIGFLSTTYLWRIVRKYAPCDYVNLHTDVLRLVMGKTDLVKPIRTACIDHGLIETDNEYQKGTKALGYRIGPALSDVTFRKYFPSSKRAQNRIVKLKDYITRAEGFSLPVHDHLSYWSRLVSLSSDYQSVLDSMPPEKASIASQQVQLILEGFIRRKVCDFGRYHSNFTCVPREVRGCLECLGERLVEIDIRNSQPFFLAVLLQSILLTDYNSSNHNFTKLNYIHSLKQNSTINLPIPSPLPPTPLCFPFLNVDFRNLMESVVNGTFYETFLRDRDNQQEREDLKPRVFEVIFGTNWTMDHAGLGETFKNIYPTAWDLMRQLKSRHGYRWLGQEMQRQESTVVINKVCGRIMVERPDVPLLTIHDSIMTTKSNVSYVEALLRQELYSTCGYLPQLRIKGQ